jgi:hypothetical protein
MTQETVPLREKYRFLPPDIPFHEGLYSIHRTDIHGHPRGHPHLCVHGSEGGAGGTDGTRREPGDRVRQRAEGMRSLDLRTLEEQYVDPRRTNKAARAAWSLPTVPTPFTKDKRQQNRNGK